MNKLKIILEMIKFEHTLFALPFALTSMVLAAHGFPGWGILFWILVAMVGARSAAMAFNRLVDREFDAKNPRTAMRALPAGLLTPKFVVWFIIASSALLVLAAWRLNPLALMLSPLALLLVFFYSLTKRFTAWSHAWLGLALAVAPVGAWVAVRGQLFEAPPLLLGASVVCWLIGFDTIYALQDVEFDRNAGLNSLPVKFGPQRALTIGRIAHAIMVLLLVGVGFTAKLGFIWYGAVVLCGVLIAVEHAIIKPDDLKRLNIAFFKINVAVGLLLLAGSILDVLIFRV
ncbi:MAG: UbiA-like polyprenyltransferase [Armatimonas sp.]